MAAARTRRPSARKATHHDRLGYSLCLALAHAQKLGTGLVVGMLAMGIAANVAVFSLINGLFLRPFPFPEPERLVYVNEAAPKWNLEHDRHQLRGLRACGTRPEAVRGHRDLRASASTSRTTNGADRMTGAGVTIEFAQGARLRPVLGRCSRGGRQAEGPRVTMIGHALWQERFGGRADVLGKELRLNGRIYTMIGVLPEGRGIPGRMRLWVPMQGDPTDRDGYSYRRRLGRLKPGVTVEQAEQDLLRVHQPIFDRATRRRSSRHSHAICARSSRAIRHGGLHAQRGGDIAAHRGLRERRRA